MSKQLAISSAFSVFAMAAFMLLATAGDSARLHHGIAGAPISAEAPAKLIELPDAPALPFIGN